MPALLGAQVLGVIGGILGSIINVGVGLAIMLIGIVFGLLMRIFFMFVKAYLSIILLVIFGPLVITLSILPGSSTGGVMLWFKTLLANILIFPVSAFIMGLGNILISRIQAPGATFWGPPLVGQNPALLGGAIGMGIILIIPEIDGVISKLLGVGGVPMGGMPGMDIAGEVRKSVQEGYARGAAGAEGLRKTTIPEIKKWLGGGSTSPTK